MKCTEFHDEAPTTSSHMPPLAPATRHVGRGRVYQNIRIYAKIYNRDRTDMVAGKYVYALELAIEFEASSK